MNEQPNDEQLQIENNRNNYCDGMMMLTKEKDFFDAVPVPDYYDFFPIIDGLLARIEQEITEITRYNEEEPSKDYEQELVLLRKKKNFCELRKKDGEEIAKIEEQATDKPKHLIFATTDAGNVYLQRDIKGIAEAHYEKIKQTLYDIENGVGEDNKEKGKMLTGNKKLSGLHELKPFKIRTFYRVLAPDLAYVIMTRFKNNDNDKRDYQEPSDRKDNTEQEFQYLRKLVKDENEKEKLIMHNEIIKNQIIAQLENSKRGVKDV